MTQLFNYIPFSLLNYVMVYVGHEKYRLEKMLEQRVEKPQSTLQRWKNVLDKKRNFLLVHL